MTELNLQPGELVDITVRGARVVVDSGLGMLTVTYVDGADEYGVENEYRLELATISTVDVTRVAPAEWPPLVGDLWRDAEGVLWFARGADRGATSGWMISSRDGADSPSTLLFDRGPMTLVYREPRGVETVTAALAAGAVSS